MHALAANVWMGITIACAAVVAAAVVVVLVGNERGIFFVVWGRYLAHLTQRLRRLHVFRPAAPIAQAQLALLFVVLAAAAFDVLPYWYAVIVVLAPAPALVLEHLAQKRIAMLDRQADAFCLALANALKSTPSIGAAIETVAAMMTGPVHEELELAVKETKVGRSLAEALEAVGPRAGSHRVATVLAAVLIGRQVGGNLPAVLDTTATTLREMERLEGVLRQKTATGRMQLWGLTIAPIVICTAIHKADPHFFDPLRTQTVGYYVVAAAVTLYVVGILLARKVMAVSL